MTSTTTTDVVTTVDLLRHGECQGGEIFRGRTDSPLTDAGWQQMYRALNGSRHWQAVVSSPMQRCLAFAEQWAQRHAVKVSVESGFREIDFGEWDGQLTADVWQQQPELAGQYFAQPCRVTPPGGEPLSAAYERIASAWQQLLNTHCGQRILLVTHGGTIRLLLAQLMSMPLDAVVRIEVPCGSRSQIRVYHQPDGDYPSLVSHNVGAT